MLSKLWAKITGGLGLVFLSRYLGSAMTSVITIAGTWLISQGAGTPADIGAAQEGLLQWLTSDQFSTWAGGLLIGGGVGATLLQDKKSK